MNLTEIKYLIADVPRGSSTVWIRNQWHRRERRASRLTIAQARAKATRDAPAPHVFPSVGNYVNGQFVAERTTP